MFSRLTFLTSRSAARVAVVLLVATVVTSAALAKRSVEPAPEPVLPPASESLTGLVRAGDVVSVSTPAAVTISETVVGVGDEVKAGDPLARIDSAIGRRELDERGLEVARATQDVGDRERMVALIESGIQRLVAEAADAPAQLALAERDAQQIPMRQARDSPERAQLAYDQAVHKERRVQQLAAQGLVAKQDVEDAHFAVQLAADDLANARLAADAARRVRTAQGEQARATRALQLAEQRTKLAEQQAALEQSRFALTAARMRYEAASQAVADPFVRAPRDGAVFDLAIHGGERLAAGALVARVAPLDPVVVDVDVPPAMVNALKVGDEALVDVQAVGLAHAKARIRSIAPIPGDDGRYTVRLTLPNPARARLAGQAAYVRLPIRPKAEHP
jgi:multidrug efflux pump subunit AcrA (membrane-fusion protein)